MIMNPFETELPSRSSLMPSARNGGRGSPDNEEAYGGGVGMDIEEEDDEETDVSIYYDHRNNDDEDVPFMVHHYYNSNTRGSRSRSSQHNRNYSSSIHRYCRNHKLLLLSSTLVCTAVIAARAWGSLGTDVFPPSSLMTRKDDNQDQDEDSLLSLLFSPSIMRLPKDPDRPIPWLQYEHVHTTLDVSSMRTRFQAARDAFIQQLIEDYGADSFHAMFETDDDDDDPVSVGRSLLRGVGRRRGNDDGHGGDIGEGVVDVSKARLRRKLLMKLLQAQIVRNRLEKNYNHNHNSKSQHLPMISFIWATGGHSAAAGHGNLYLNESYSVVLERALEPALRGTGLVFQVKNYAMGGMHSGPEIALCNTAIFGVNYDVLSWDFDMLDSDQTWRSELYFRQAAMHPNRPAVVGIGTNFYGRQGLMRILENLEHSGISSLFVSHQVMEYVEENIPDCAHVITNASQLANMPKFVKSFKCDGSIEQGDPGCSSEKFTPLTLSAECKKIKYRVSWHPGWKKHALIGNLIALALFELVDDALVLLAEMDLSDPEARFRELKKEEDADYAIFAQSTPTSFYESLMQTNTTSTISISTEPNHDVDTPDDPTTTFDGFNMSLLYLHRPYCHTALLPAEARFSGVLTETSNQIGFFHYDQGVSEKHLYQMANNSSKLRLAFDPSFRQSCNALLEVDYKDFFYLSEPEGMKHLILPNDAERRIYYPNNNNDSSSWQGFVAYSLHGCDWGKCRTDELHESDLETGGWEMTINDIPVTKSVNIKGGKHLGNSNVYFVRHAQGWQFPTSPPPNQGGKEDEEEEEEDGDGTDGVGRFEIQIRITEVGKHMRFRSFIIF